MPADPWDDADDRIGVPVAGAARPKLAEPPRRELDPPDLSEPELRPATPTWAGRRRCRPAPPR